MATTFTSIATTTVASATAAVNFNSIPQTYTDLRVVFNILSNGSNYAYYRLNNDDSGSYGQQVLYSSPSGTITVRNLSLTTMYLNYNYSLNSTAYTTGSVDLNSYSENTFNKTALIQSFRAQVGMEASAGIRFNDAAITSINIACQPGLFEVGSTFTLYGILRA